MAIIQTFNVTHRLKRESIVMLLRCPNLPTTYSHLSPEGSLSCSNKDNRIHRENSQSKQ